MTFIRSISGFRGTIGGPEQDNLTPPDIVRAAQGYGSWILAGRKAAQNGKRPCSGRWAETPGHRETWWTGWSAAPSWAWASM